MTLPLSQVFVFCYCQSYHWVCLFNPLRVEVREENSLSPRFPAEDVSQTSGTLSTGNCSIREIILFSVLKGCEFLDHQSYLHSNISIWAHLSPNIGQPFAMLVLGDRIYVGPMDTLCLLISSGLWFLNWSTMISLLIKGIYSRNRFLFCFSVSSPFPPSSFFPSSLLLISSPFYFSSSLSSHFLLLLLVSNFISWATNKMGIIGIPNKLKRLRKLNSK